MNTPNALPVITALNLWDEKEMVDAINSHLGDRSSPESPQLPTLDFVRDISPVDRIEILCDMERNQVLSLGWNRG